MGKKKVREETIKEKGQRRTEEDRNKMPEKAKEQVREKNKSENPRKSEKVIGQRGQRRVRQDHSI